MAAQKFVISLLLLITSLVITPLSVFASSLDTSNSIATFSSSPITNSNTLTPIPSYIPPTSPIYTDLMVSNIFHTFSCLAVGSSTLGQPCLIYQLTKNAQGTIQSVPMLSSVDLSGGTLGAFTGIITALYQNQPVRTADYLASVEQNFGIVKEAHAQVNGSGANILNPVFKLWEASRNISYVLMIIIFVIIGVMVMFRQKINPQTVITAQAAIPGLFIGLILITFSYFLAALLTDTAFVGTNLVGSYFSLALGNNNNNLTETLKNENILSIMSRFIGSVHVGDLNSAVSSIITPLGVGPKTVISVAAAILSYTYAAQAAGVAAVPAATGVCLIPGVAGIINPIGELDGAGQNTAVNIPGCIVNSIELIKQTAGFLAAGLAIASPASVISMALFVILYAILLYTMFKLLFRLVTCFLNIILFTIIGPFYFLISSMPGRQGIATGWILDMLSNILAFPAVIAVFYFVNYLLGSNAQTAFPITSGPLDLNSTGNLPLFGKLDINFIRFILAFGALIATPSIPDIVSRAIGRVSQTGQIIGQEIGGGLRSGQGYVGQAQQSIGALGSSAGDTAGYVYNEGTGTWRRDFSHLAGARPGYVSKAIGFFKGPLPNR